jgi:hypothetical protein
VTEGPPRAAYGGSRGERPQLFQMLVNPLGEPERVRRRQEARQGRHDNLFGNPKLG